MWPERFTLSYELKEHCQVRRPADIAFRSAVATLRFFSLFIFTGALNEIFVTQRRCVLVRSPKIDPAALNFQLLLVIKSAGIHVDIKRSPLRESCARKKCDFL